jgi:apolipoprotein N-acyltransferase
VIGLALALFSGLLLVGLFPPFSWTWLAPFALSPLLVAVAREARPLRRFLFGYAAGVLYWFSVCLWIETVLERYGAMGKFGGWGAFLLFCLAKAMHLGAFALLAGILIHKPYALPAIAALWVGIERTHGPLGFAWLTLGDAGTSMSVPLRLAPFTGVYGLSFVFAFLGAGVTLLVLRRPRAHIYPIAALALLLLLPRLPEPRKGTDTAVVLQPNASEDFEWTAESLGQFENSLIRLSVSTAQPPGSARLIVWPEAPLPLYYYRDPGFRSDAQNLPRVTQSFFLFGTVANTLSGDPTNSAIMLDPSGQFIDRYDKNVLVPFGEFIPPGFSWVNRISQETGDFAPGNRIFNFPMGGHHVGTFICYEGAFPDLIRRFTVQGADLLVNITNDGYFGRSAAREQHLRLERMRAVENNRWIVRATNDGTSAVIDPAGRLATTLPPYRQLAARVPYAYETRMTFYALYGDWFAWSCLALASLALLIVWSVKMKKSATAGA